MVPVKEGVGVFYFRRERVKDRVDRVVLGAEKEIKTSKEDASGPRAEPFTPV